MNTQKKLKIKRILTVALSAIMTIASLGSIAACKQPDIGTGNKPIDTSKTQLNIGVYNGGLGFAWVREVATKFEEYYAETSFEPNKKGVQISIDPQKDTFLTSALLPNLKAGTAAANDIYYTCSNYYDYADSTSSGVVLDVSDMLAEKVYDDNGELAEDKNTATKSILDKMDPFFVENYKYSDGKYYGWPFEDGVGGLVYDVDLFEENGWKVPETMEEFSTLLDTMLLYNVTPYTFSAGAGLFYTTWLTSSVIAQYEGQEAANMNLTYSGTYSGNRNIDANGYITTADGTKVLVGNQDFHGSYDEVEITPENAYLLADQQGKYEALKFLELLTAKSEYYSANAYLKSQTHLDAQTEFVYSTQYAEEGKTNRIAMLLDGDWWENEARENFNTMGSGANASRYGYGVRNFNIMPIPYMEGQKSEQRMLYSFNGGRIAFINKNTAVPDVAKKFVQFQHQNSCLSIFTGATGSVLPYDYDLLPSDEARMTKFARNVWDLRHDENVAIFRQAFSKAPEYEQASIKLSGLSTEIKLDLALDTTYVMKIFHYYRDKGYTAEDLFASSLRYYNRDDWENSYEMYLETFGE